MCQSGGFMASMMELDSTFPCFSWFLWHIYISLYTWTSCRTLSRRPATVPAAQVWPCRKSRPKTGNSLEQLLWLSWRRSRKQFVVNCSDSSSHQYFCRRLSVEPWMDACSYVIRNRFIDPSVPPSPIVLSQARFYESTNFSAWPFDWGWYRGNCMCSIAWLLQYSLN